MNSQPTDLKDYWKDANGNLVHINNIKPIDKLRSEVVTTVAGAAIELNLHIAKIKKLIFGDVLSFIDLSFEQYGAKIGGKKGNTTLYTFDGTFKIQLAISDRLQFDERIHAAKALIDECLKDWTHDSVPIIKTLINQAFNVDKEGNLNTYSILSLRRIDNDDLRWQQAMQAIGDSVQTVGSKSYIRVYSRNINGDYEQILLDFASV